LTRSGILTPVVPAPSEPSFHHVRATVSSNASSIACSSVNARVVNAAFEINFVTGLVARADAQLVCIVERLSSKGREAVLRAGEGTVHVPQHIASAIEDHSDVMPLAVIDGFSVAGEDVDCADVRLVENRAEGAVRGDAHSPSIRISTANEAHFGYNHAGIGCCDPGCDGPIPRADVEPFVVVPPDWASGMSA
jgi:hypothetical protein